MKKKIGRNEPCPCGSGKKFKKCCESTMIGKKYMAHKIETADQTSSKISSLTSLISPSIVEPQPEKKLKISASVNEPRTNEENKDLDAVVEQPKKIVKVTKKAVKKVTKTLKTTKAPKKESKKKATSESS